MSKVRIGEVIAYLFVSLLAVGGGAFLSLQFLQSATSQEGEDTPEEDAPPEGVVEKRPEFPKPISSETSESVRSLEVFLEPYIYDAKDRRDPFEAYEVASASGPSASSTPLTPLQRYPLDQLQLIGVMWDIKNPKAMFTDPNSKVHVIGRDEGIGNRNGYIEAIREGEVVVVEAVRSETGVEYETKVIKLTR